jgi:LmbE family N-acetylglucosaminyl deacetylase
MTPPITILSPHLDDAVLSCWHLLDGPGDVRVVNVFAGVPPPGTSTGWWDRAAGNGDSARVVAARIEEDRAALARAGRRAVNLDFLDGQYREGPEDADALAAALREHVPSNAVVYAPAAFVPLDDDPRLHPFRERPHPDHAAVRDAALVLRGDGHAVGLYADLPHAGVVGWPGWPQEVPRLDGLVAEPRRLPAATFERKLRAVREYRSQVAIIERVFARRLDDPALLGYEVVWRPPAAVANG